MIICITGGAGFVGSHIAIYLKSRYRDYQVIALDNLKRRGSEYNLSRLARAGVTFIHGDIRQPADLLQLPKYDVLVDAAAEPSVIAGIENGLQYLIDSNLNGSIHSIRQAMDHHAKIIFLSTSRVYPIEALNAIPYDESESRYNIATTQSLPGVTGEGINEQFPLHGARSFYGFSKLASEQFLQECVEFCQAQAVINRCGVIAGPHQMGKVDQGFICFWVARHVWNKALQYFGFEGSGKQVRDVLHIDDLTSLIDLQIHQFDAVRGETFNVGGGLNGSTSLRELTEQCGRITGNRLTPGKVAETRTADIRIYISDNQKITNTLKWKPTVSMEDIVQDTYDWIKSDESALETILNI